MRRLGVGVPSALLALTIGCSKPPDQSQGAGQAANGPAPGAKPAYEVSYTGYISRVYDYGQEDCVNATKVALQRLSLHVDEESPGLFKKSFVASGADGTSVAVQAVELGKAATRVSIKVGYLLGDRDAAQRIHSEIESQLGRQGGGAVAADKMTDWGAPAEPAAQVTTTSRPNPTFWAPPTPTSTQPPPPAPRPTIPTAPTAPPPPPPAGTVPPAPAPGPASRPSPPPAGAPAAGWD